MTRVFKIEKYRGWFINKKNLSDQDVDNLIYLNNMNELNNLEQHRLEQDGHIILDEWCDEVI